MLTGTYQKFDEKWLSPLYNCSREEQWKHWTPFPNLIRKVESITFTEDQINGIPFVQNHKQTKQKRAFVILTKKRN